MFDGNWEFDNTNLPEPSNMILSTSSPLGGACTQFYRKRNINNTDDERQGSVTIYTSGNTGIFYTSFWYRQSALNTLGSGPSTKYFRHYFGESPRDFYLGTGFQNTSEAGYPPAADGGPTCYGTTAFGGLDDTEGLPANTWMFLEVVEFLRGGETLWGSADYLEHWATIPGESPGRQRLFRRGSNLASQHNTIEGSDSVRANERYQWLGADLGNTDADNNHTCGDLGSLFDGGSPGGNGGFLDYHDAYQSYTLARVMVGNASTFSACDAFHMQVPLTWSDTQITATLNRGQWADFTGKYLYVINASNEVSAGYAL